MFIRERGSVLRLRTSQTVADCVGLAVGVMTRSLANNATMSSITDLGAEAAEQSNQNDGDDTDSGFPELDLFDVSGMAFAKQHPPTAVRGVAVEDGLRYFPGNPEEEGWGRGYFGLVLESPTVVTDDDNLSETIVVQGDSEQESDAYKIVNEADDATKLLDGSGVDFSGNLYYGEPVEDFTDDEIVLKATGSSGKSIATTLDANGATGARKVGSYDSEDVELGDTGWPVNTGGLQEYDPSGDVAPRISRHTSLRPDVVGRELIILVQRLAEIDEDYDGSAYWATVMVEAEEGDDVDFTAEDGTGFTTIEPTSEFDVESARVERASVRFDGNKVPLAELNEARTEAGFDPYEPDESSEAEAEAEAE